MTKKKKEEVNLDELNLPLILEEAVVCSRLGRTIASFGATLTGKEKADAKLAYVLLKSGKELSEKSYATAEISTDKKTKEYTYAQAVKWFTEKYPKEAEPLLKKLKEEYEAKETTLIYGVRQGKELPDEHYVKILTEILEIPKDQAAVMYHGVIKPQLDRMKEEEGLVKLVMK